MRKITLSLFLIIQLIKTVTFSETVTSVDYNDPEINDTILYEEKYDIFGDIRLDTETDFNLNGKVSQQSVRVMRKNKYVSSSRVKFYDNGIKSERKLFTKKDILVYTWDTAGNTTSFKQYEKKRLWNKLIKDVKWDGAGHKITKNIYNFKKEKFLAENALIDTTPTPAARLFFPGGYFYANGKKIPDTKNILKWTVVVRNGNTYKTIHFADIPIVHNRPPKIRKSDNYPPELVFDYKKLGLKSVVFIYGGILKENNDIPVIYQSERFKLQFPISKSAYSFSLIDDNADKCNYYFILNNKTQYLHSFDMLDNNCGYTVADFDGDNKPDLYYSWTGWCYTSYHLYLSSLAKPGYLLRLAGRGDIIWD